MIEVKGLPKYIKSPEVKEILTEHINNILKETIVFIGAFSGKGKFNGFSLSYFEQRKLRASISPITIKEKEKIKGLKDFINPIYYKIYGADKERKELILSLLRKLYSDDIQELTVEEKFVLIKACYVAIEKEEEMIDMLALQDNMRLETWMWGRYMIEDTDKRRKVLKHLRKLKIGSKEYPKEILEEKPIQVRERILDVIGQLNMLIFEYPTVINLVFNPQEYQLLVGVQLSDSEDNNPSQKAENKENKEESNVKETN